MRVNRLMPLTVVFVLMMLAGCANEQPFTGQTFAQDTQQGSDSGLGVFPTPQSSGAAGGLNGASSEAELVDLVVSQLGVDSRQAKGGIGAIFALAQQRMDPSDFMRLSSSVPGMEQYLSAVPQSTSSISWFSSTESLLSEQGNGLGKLAVLATSFQALGMNADMIREFVPLLMQYIQGQSGPEALSLLQSALY